MWKKTLGYGHFRENDDKAWGIYRILRQTDVFASKSVVQGIFMIFTKNSPLLHPIFQLSAGSLHGH
jgi:hypothetical protein